MTDLFSGHGPQAWWRLTFGTVPPKSASWPFWNNRAWGRQLALLFVLKMFLLLMGSRSVPGILWHEREAWRDIAASQALGWTFPVPTRSWIPYTINWWFSVLFCLLGDLLLTGLRSPLTRPFPNAQSRFICSQGWVDVGRSGVILGNAQTKWAKASR